MAHLVNLVKGRVGGRIVWEHALRPFYTMDGDLFHESEPDDSDACLGVVGG